MKVYNYTFTVFTPSFNRVHTIPRVYESLKRQTFRDFEWLIVDDGSNDGTGQLVAKWQSESLFPIRYFYQENRGKHVAFNFGVREAQGELFLTLDSDDKCVPEALEKFKYYWDSIPIEKRSSYSAVTALCCDNDGQEVGTRFPENVWDSNSIESHIKYRIKGEKWGFQRTDILKRFPFPEPKGVKFVAESVVWFAISKHYRTRYINEALRIYYAKDYSNCTERLTHLNDKVAIGRIYGHKAVLNDCSRYFFNNPLYFIKSSINFTRYNMFVGRNCLTEIHSLEKTRAKLLCFISIPFGWLLCLRDKFFYNNSVNCI